MSIAQELAPPTARWDLSALFSGMKDPKIEETWKAQLQKADEFAAKYRGKINREDLGAQSLASALREVEALIQEAAKPANYAQLLFAGDTSSPEVGAFMQAQMERSTELNVKLLFFELELQAVPQETIDRIISDPALSNYTHYITVARTLSPFRLTEPEEIILEETANTGSRAWVRLYEEVLSTHSFYVKMPGEDEAQEMTEEEVMTLLRHPDRGVRQAAGDALTKGIQDLQRIVVFIYNNLLQDKRVDDRLRSHPYPEHSRHLSNELDKETVDLVIELCVKNYTLVERFYNVKRQILGIDRLSHVDRYAPLFDTEGKIGYNEAKEIVLGAFGQFSKTLSERAGEFFDQSWIDAEPRKGKQGGAFCAYITPDTHPVVLMSYLNKINDVMTLAHELGHGVHAALSRKQSYFNFHGTLPLAELASIFGEMLVFEKVTADASTMDKLALYAAKIEGMFASVFRQAALYRFEQRSHQTRRAEGELTPDQFGDIWNEELQAMFGNSLHLEDQHRDWWAFVGHFFFAPFYVYAYSFGELLVLSLYQMAKDEGPDFAEKYVALLELGGSKTPQELMATVGVDLRSRTFWQGGFEAMEKMVSTFENLWSEYSAAKA